MTIETLRSAKTFASFITNMLNRYGALGEKLTLEGGRVRVGGGQLAKGSKALEVKGSMFPTTYTRIHLYECLYHSRINTERNNIKFMY